MNNTSKKAPDEKKSLADEVGIQVERKLKARRKGIPRAWLGLGVMGLIGWSVVVPTLLGAALGVWLDHHYPTSFSWALALLVCGLTLGCFNAWIWVSKEYKDIRKEQEDDE